MPIAVESLSALYLQSIGISDTKDLLKAVPGVNLIQGLANPGTYVRGVGSGYSTVGGESPVAYYVDEVYRASTSGGYFKLHNIQSIDVLKGPQGTLFGRNATGGVINVTTKDPSSTLTGTASAEAGSYGLYSGVIDLVRPAGQGGQRLGRWLLVASGRVWPQHRHRQSGVFRPRRLCRCQAEDRAGQDDDTSGWRLEAGNGR